jgi:hypothetical protein
MPVTCARLAVHSSSQVRASTSAALLLGALTFSLAACGDASEAPSEPDPRTPVVAGSSTPTPPAAPEYDTEFTISGPDISDGAEQEFGADGAVDGTAAAVELSETAFYDDQCIVTAPGENADECAYSLGDSMTPSAREDWNQSVKDFIDDSENDDYGSSEGSALVLSLCFYGAMVGVQEMDGQKFRANATGPVMVNKKISNVTTGVAADGRLSVAMKSSADMRLLVDDEPRLWHLGRTITYYMVKTNNGWKVDAWNGTWAKKGMSADQ